MREQMQSTAMRLIGCRSIGYVAILQLMDVRRRLGRNLQRLRQEKGLSQEAFADLAGLHRTYVSGVERGIRNPTVTVLQKLADTLGIKIGSLVDV
jgi:DNA-binding XRE family transcriptional regulator